MKGFLLFFMLLATICLGDEPKGKYAIILQSGNETNESGARAEHALIYANDLLEDGYAVLLIFDGAGTGWAHEFSRPEHKMNPEYVNLKKLGLMEVICDTCAEGMNVKGKLSEEQRALLTNAHKGHPSIVLWIEKGYQIISL
jgi:hypothetical protein